MTIPLFRKLKLLCIAVTLALGACGGGSNSLAPTPVPEVVVPPVPDNRSVLTLQLMDIRSQGAGTGPLSGNPYDGFSFLLNGNPIVVRSSAINTARTYPDLSFAIEAAVNGLKPTNAALANLAVTLGPDFTRFDAGSGLPVVGQSILLTDRSGGILTQNPNAGWQLLVGGFIPVDSFYKAIIDSSEVSQ